MNRENLIELYLIYKDLLFLKQKEYFENYYLEDYTLSEISENYSVSRAIVNKTIKIVEKKLINYERVLKIKEKYEKLFELYNEIKEPKIKEKLKNIIDK